MNISRGTQIVTDFVQSLRSKNSTNLVRSSISRQVFQYTGRNTVLLYIKGRAQAPYRWGVTANVIQRLQSQSKPWNVLLLYEVHETRFFLTSKDVEYYIKHTWPLGRDGDYKPATGSYLAKNISLNSIDDFIKHIEASCC